MQVMLQHTAGRLLSFPLFAFSLLIGGAVCAQGGKEPGWTASGFGAMPVMR
jgi:hypothetical protein